MEISAKLKARHVQIHIFHTKQNENDHHRYSQTGSWVQGAQNKRLHNVAGLDCTQFLLSKVRT